MILILKKILNDKLISSATDFISGRPELFSFERRLLISTCFFGIFISVIGLIGNFVIGLSLIMILIPVFGVLLFTFLFYLSKKKVSQDLVFWIFALSGLFTMSALWVFNGGMNGPNLILYFIFLMVCLYISRPIFHYKIFALVILNLSILIYINFNFPDKIQEYKVLSDRYQDMSITTLGYLIIIFYFIRFSMNNYLAEREKVEAEGIKIKEINIELIKKNKEINNQYLNLDQLNSELQKSYTLITQQNKNLELLNEDLKIKNNRINDQNIILENINDELLQKNEKINLQNKEFEILTQQLTEANNTKDKFFSIIAHDLIGPISGMHEIIKLFYHEFDSYSGEEKIEMLNHLQISSWNTYSLLDNLLTWSRIQSNKISFKPEEFWVHNSINLIINQLKISANNKNIAIENNSHENLLIYADKNSFLAIIRNLISNAIKFTPFNGIIRINTENLINSTVISVSDNGIGMNHSQVDELFKIENTKSTPGTNNERGTGLGLILCKEFVEKNNGKIWVRSERGIGSTFSFSIPLFHHPDKY